MSVDAARQARLKAVRGNDNFRSSQIMCRSLGLPMVRIAFLLPASLATALVFWIGINGSNGLHAWIAGHPGMVEVLRPWLLMCILGSAAVTGIRQVRAAE